MDLCRLDNRAIRDRSVLDDNNNAVANYKAKILTSTILNVILIDHPDVPAYAGVLIDDGSLDGRVCSDPQRNLSTLHGLQPFLRGFVEI